MLESSDTVGGSIRAESGAARLSRWLSLRAYGLVTSTLFGATTPPQRMRARFERVARVSRRSLRKRYPSLAFGDHLADGIPIESVRAVESPRRVIVHLHGGGYFMGSTASYRDRARRLSFRLEAEVFVPEYRLAPEHPYPAALEDALAAVRQVQELRPGLPLFVTGDSAGGGLALGVLIRLRELRLPAPAGAILLSPWTDLTVSGRSVETNHGKDLWLSRAHLEAWARYYVGDADAGSPHLSAVFGDLSRLPPFLVLAGEHEVLLDDARRVQESAVRAGTDARLIVGPRMQHDWPLTLPWLEESRQAWRAMSGFVAER